MEDAQQDIVAPGLQLLDIGPVARVQLRVQTGAGRYGLHIHEIGAEVYLKRSKSAPVAIGPSDEWYCQGCICCGNLVNADVNRMFGVEWRSDLA